MTGIALALAAFGAVAIPAAAQDVRPHGGGFPGDLDPEPSPAPIVTPVELWLVSCDDSSIELGWICKDVLVKPPGWDVNLRVPATAYELRFSTTELPFEEMSPVEGMLPDPAEGGVSQVFRVQGLSSATSYRFILRTIYGVAPDEVSSDSEPMPASTLAAAIAPPGPSAGTESGRGAASGGSAIAGCGQSATGGSGGVLLALLAGAVLLRR